MLSTRRLRSAGPEVERMERSPLSAFRGLDTTAGVESAIRTVETRIGAQGRERRHALAAIEVERDRGERTALKARASGLGDAIARDELVLAAFRDRLRRLRENEAIVARGGVPLALPEAGR